MYGSYLIEANEVNKVLAEVNEAGREVVGVCYVSDSQQVLLIVNDKGRSEDEEG